MGGHLNDVEQNASKVIQPSERISQLKVKVSPNANLKKKFTSLESNLNNSIVYKDPKNQNKKF